MGMFQAKFQITCKTNTSSEITQRLRAIVNNWCGVYSNHINSNLFGVIGKFFKVSIFNILTGQKRDIWFVWSLKIILSFPRCYDLVVFIFTVFKTNMLGTASYFSQCKCDLNYDSFIASDWQLSYSWSLQEVWPIVHHMISSLANYRPFFSSFPHIPPSGELCQVS